MKKILALALVLVLALGMMVPVSAAAVKFSGLDTSSTAFGKVGLMDSFDVDCGPGYISPKISVPFDYFKYDNLPTGVTDINAYLTAQGEKYALRLAKTLNFRVRHRVGSRVVDEVRVDSVDTSGAVWFINIVFETVDPFVSVNDADYEVDVYFEINGRTDNAWYFTVSGNFSNDVTEVYADSVEADSWEGQVIEAKEYVPKIILVANEEEDVLAHIKMAKDKKIYFVVTTESDMADESVFDKYPSIEWAYKVTQIGLNGYTGNFIELAGVDNTYYVYGKDANGALKFLGRGGEMLPLSAKYYVSSTKLNLVDDSAIDEDLPTDPVPDDNFNPSTGI